MSLCDFTVLWPKSEGSPQVVLLGRRNWGRGVFRPTELFPIICQTCLSHLCVWFLIEIFYTMALVCHQDYDSSWIPGHWTKWKPKPEDKEQRGTKNLILGNLFYLAYPSLHCCTFQLLTLWMIQIGSNSSLKHWVEIPPVGCSCSVPSVKDHICSCLGLHKRTTHM